MDRQLLDEWNPWWELKTIPEVLKGTERKAYKTLVNSADIREVTIILGVRRAGKSTLMYQMIARLFSRGIAPEQVLFVNLEDKKLRSHSLDDIYHAYRRGINPNKKAYVLFDEVHKREGWESWIRKKYDLQENAKFVVSGSCAYLLRKEYATLLTGRNLTFEVYPLSFEEFLAFNHVSINKNAIAKGVLLEKTKDTIFHQFTNYLSLGGFPEVVKKQDAYKMHVLEQYFDDILYKDIIDRHNLNSQKVKDFALYVMTNITGLLSLRNARNALQLSYSTIKDYLSDCKEAFLFFVLDAFSYSFNEQKTRPSKVYCVDNGLRNAVSFMFSKDEGKAAENLVFLELRRRKKSAYYWKKKGEVDFVIKNADNSLDAINMSYTNDVDAREEKSLGEFKNEFEEKTRSITIITKDTERREGGITYIPLWKWLLLYE